MLDILQAILVNTFNPNSQIRLEAESNLNNFLTNTPSALTSLLLFIGSSSIHPDVRKAAAIVIKNNIKDFYRQDERAVAITLDEKERAKLALVDVMLVEVDNSIRGILAESIRNVAEFEYPERWGNLLPTLLGFIQSSDILKMYNALLALRKLVKRYEYKFK